MKSDAEGLLTVPQLGPGLTACQSVLFHKCPFVVQRAFAASNEELLDVFDGSRAVLEQASASICIITAPAADNCSPACTGQPLYDF